MSKTLLQKKIEALLQKRIDKAQEKIIDLMQMNSVDIARAARDLYTHDINIDDFETRMGNYYYLHSTLEETIFILEGSEDDESDKK
jgi:hypothetical protein